MTTQQAAQYLRQGGIVAYPTEAVFGLGCDPANTRAIQQLLALKHRSADKGLILIGAEFSHLEPWVQISETEREELVADWPAGTSYVLPASARCSALLTGGRDSIAVRQTRHPQAQALCEAFDGAVVSTSANLSDQLPARTAEGVRQQFGEAVSIVDGSVGSQQSPSRVVDFRSGEVYRDG